MNPPPNQVALATRYGRQYGVDPRLLLAIGGHETQWGSLGAGRQGYTLGYGATDSGTISKYAGVDNQYRFAAQTLAKWGVRSLSDVMAGKAASYASDPAWEKGVASMYAGLGGAVPATQPSQAQISGAAPPMPTGPAPLNAAALAAVNQSLRSWSGGPQMGGAPAEYRLNTPTVTMAPRAAQQGVTPPTVVGHNLASLASAQLGQPYVWGGETRKEGGFDCSGLVDWALRQQGYQGPRVTTWTLAKMGTSVKGQQLHPGDLVLANHGEHVVIYAGNGRVIAAPHTGTVVQYQPLSKFQITDVRRL